MKEIEAHIGIHMPQVDSAKIGIRSYVRIPTNFAEVVCTECVEQRAFCPFSNVLLPRP